MHGFTGKQLVKITCKNLLPTFKNTVFNIKANQMILFRGVIVLNKLNEIHEHSVWAKCVYIFVETNAIYSTHCSLQG